MAVSTCDPTCEQWLAARGQVLGYPSVVLVVIAVVVPLLDPGNMAINTHYPPCEQWLTAVVVGALQYFTLPHLVRSESDRTTQNPRNPSRIRADS